MDEPGILHGLLLLRRELHRSLNDVRELKNEAEEQTGRDMHGQESDEELPPRHIEKQQRDHDDIGIVDRLHDEEFGDFSLGVHDVAVRTEVAPQQVHKILHKDPEQRGHAVSGQHVEMLVPVNRVMLGGWRKTK